MAAKRRERGVSSGRSGVDGMGLTAELRVRGQTSTKPAIGALSMARHGAKSSGFAEQCSALRFGLGAN